MAKVRGKADEIVNSIAEALRKYEEDHAGARVDVYRQNPASVRIRVVDGSFKGKDKTERHAAVWRYLESLPEEVQSDVSMLVVVTPDETRVSAGNLEFESPVPSGR